MVGEASVVFCDCHGKRKAPYKNHAFKMINHMSWFKDLIEIDYIYVLVVKDKMWK